MDNMTHSLVGYAVGKTLLSFKKTKSRTRYFDTSFISSSILANNLPDLDLLYHGITPGHLGTMLHHRGHTHTLMMAFPLAAMVLCFVGGFLKIRRATFSKNEWLALFGCLVLGLWTHVFFDSFNSYGVHPFWPLDNRWYYGDTLFILEPWIWLTLMPLVLFVDDKRVRAGALTAVLGTFGLVWFTGFIFPAISLFLMIWALAVSGALCWMRPARRAPAVLVLLFVILLVFETTSLQAKRQLRAWHQTTNPNFILDDLILSPLPSNPFCWTLTTVEHTSDGTDYLSRRGIYAPFSSLVSAFQCTSLRQRGRSTSSFSQEDASFEWANKTEMPLAQWREKVRTHCALQAFLRFSRVPYFQETNDEIASRDLRFDRGRDTLFGLSTPERPAPCPPYVPAWTPPREALFF
jgi:inner membrane protein